MFLIHFFIFWLLIHYLSGQQWPMQVNDSQHKPMMANEDWCRLTMTTITTTTINNGRRKPMMANEDQCRPKKATQAHDSQWRPMQAHDSQQRPIRAHSSQHKPIKSHTGIRYVSIFFISSFTTDISEYYCLSGQCRPKNSQHRPMTSCMMIEMCSITCTYLIAIK